MSEIRLDSPDSQKDYLLSFDAFRGAARQEGVNYLNDAFQRLMITLSLIPRFPEGATPALLELGANPYFMTLLLKHFRSEYRLSLANYFGPHWVGLEHSQRIGSEKYQESYDFSFLHFNVEIERFPYPDASFDFVLFCEIIEHLEKNPTWPLVEIHRILKPGGQVLITTPNVLRLQNIIALLKHKNIYDPYSGYGPYGRHNREYTSHELAELVQGCGFEIARVVMADKYIHPVWQYLPRKLWRRFRDNIYLVARATRSRTEYRPAWLYRSFY
jgi:SAM-dependent methyltransferase